MELFRRTLTGTVGQPDQLQLKVSNDDDDDDDDDDDGRWTTVDQI